MSHINQYNYLSYNEKNIKEKTIKPSNKNPNSAVVRINPANLNNYQQIIKNEQINQKINHEIESTMRVNNHQNNNSHKNNLLANFNNQSIFILNFLILNIYILFQSLK